MFLTREGLDCRIRVLKKLKAKAKAHDVFWCVLCVWAKLPEIKLDDDDDGTWYSAT